MRLMLAIALSASLLLVDGAAAQNAKTCGRAGDPASLTGTSWKGTFTWSGDPAVAQTMTLLPDCTVKYSYKGSTYTNGRWLQRGDMVMWNTNDHFAIYLGFVTGGELGGTMANQNGAYGSWTFKRAD